MKEAIIELIRELIKKEYKSTPKPERVPVINSVMTQLTKKEPMTDYEKENWEQLVIEMVNNYY